MSNIPKLSDKEPITSEVNYSKREKYFRNPHKKSRTLFDPMPQLVDSDIVIVGGGICGLSTALALHRLISHSLKLHLS